VIYRAEDKRGPSTRATASPLDTFAKILGTVTNNEAEYNGLEMGLTRAIKLGATQVTAYVDSLLVCKQIRGEYSIRHNKTQQLHDRCRILINKLQQFTIEHTPRVYNAEADEQCNIALDSIQADASGRRSHLDGPVDIVWAEFCKDWHKDTARSLVVHYPTERIERKELPIYTMIDSPKIMAKRARLRFRRAQFGHNNKRINLPSNTHCDHDGCDGKELSEDTEHVLMVCPRNARDRDKLRHKMATLLAPSTPQTSHQLLSMILDIPYTRALKAMAQAISRITGEFILAVYRNKQF
jgi:ribonuclease HI